MQPNRTLFFGIVGLAVVIVAGMFAAIFLLGDSLNLPTGRQPANIQVVAAASIKPWAEQAAQAFNQSQPDVRVEIVEASGLIPRDQFNPGDPQAIPPAAWLAEATFVVEMAGLNDLPFTGVQSVASDSLAWGAFNNRLESLAGPGDALTWEAVHNSAVAPNSTLKLVVASPVNTAEGLAALMSAAAAHLNTQTLSGAAVKQAEPWLSETFKESARGSFTLGPQPAEAFATRGPSIGDAGILSMASWQRAGLQNRPDFTITPAAPNISLDFPFAIYAGSRATPQGQQAAAAFKDFLLGQARQDTLAEQHLEPAGAVVSGVQVNGDAALTLLRWAELELAR